MKPQVEFHKGNEILFKDEAIGRYKNPTWKDQSEIRYMFKASYFDVNRINECPLNFLPNILIDYKEHNQCPISFLDIPINFNRLEITLGPLIDSSKAMKIAQKIYGYVSNAEVKRSSLKIRF